MANAADHYALYLGVWRHRSQARHGHVEFRGNASHRTSSGTGAEASRRSSGESPRSARVTAAKGSRCAHGEPPNGAPR